MGLTAVMFFTACGNGSIGGSTPEGPDQPENIVSTPTKPHDPKFNPLASELPKNTDEQKVYLEKAASLCLETFQAKDQKAALDLADELYFEIDNYSWDTQGFEDFWSDIESDFAFVAPRYISQLANGRVSPMDVRQFTYKLAKFANVFEADSRSHHWVNKGKSNDGSAQLIYKLGGSTCVAKLWGEGKENTYTYTYYMVDKSEKRFYWYGSSRPNEYYYEYVGYGNGDYNGSHNYVGAGNGSYIYTKFYEYVYVGEGFGDYIYNYNSSYSRYVYTPGEGDYVRFSAADAVYNSEYGVYGFNYTYWRHDFSERDNGTASEKTTITATLPERMYLTLTQDGVELVRLVVGNDFVENQHYNQDITLTLANVNYISQIKCSHTAANAVFGLNYGNQAILYAEVKVPNYNVPVKSDNQTYEEYGTNIADHWEDIVNTVGTTTAYINLMGTTQLRAAVTNVGTLVDDYRNWMDQYDSDMDSRMSREAARALCNIYKRNCTTGVYYGTDDLQADLVLDSYMDDYYYDSSRKYRIEPLIHFTSDDTQYSFSEYFTEARYANIIDLTENLANSYLRLLRSFGVEPIELR